MFKANADYLNLQGSYLFSEIARRVREYSENNPDKAENIIRLGIGDVTQPLVPAVIKALHAAVDEMAVRSTFRGYGPEQGYDFLREKIAKCDYAKYGVDIAIDEIFVSDGSKCDTGNIGDILSHDCRIAVTDPVYPVYVDTNVMAGRSGAFDAEKGQFSNITYLPTTAENGFEPALPETEVDVVYLCSPNNPTGTALNRTQLKKWVDWANEKGVLILFDGAYEAFISEDDIPHSIYEIEGAKNCAIEFRSYSKTAGFTGTRCAYTVIPRTVEGSDGKGGKMNLNAMWLRRHTTKFNGTSYITQRAAEAIYTEEGAKQVREVVDFYLANAKIIKNGLENIGISAYGGINSPYVWLKTPEGIDSWTFFDRLLNDVQIVGTPGSGFGACGEGYFRLTAFNTKENTEKAIERLAKLSF